MEQLWTEKYRPSTISDYVFTDENLKNQIKQIIETKNVTHLLFHGGAGTGKTTLAKVLVNELGVHEYDFMQINASRDNGVDFIKSKVEGFVSTMPFGDFKIILLDEADFLSTNSQAILRGLMETYAGSARFFLTCNYKNRIIPALQSRCNTITIEKPEQVEFMARAATILLEENVEFDIDVLNKYVDMTYPDLRKCLNALQSNSVNKVLQEPSSDNAKTVDWHTDAVELFKNGNIRQARTLITSQASVDDIDSIFRWMYDNLDVWSSTPEGQDEAILIIRKGLVNNSMVADAEINLSATLCELCAIHK